MRHIEEKPRVEIATLSPYRNFTRDEWSHKDEGVELSFSDHELQRLRSLNEPLTTQEIMEVYVPLCRLLQIHIAHYRSLHSDYDRFFGKECQPVPYVIGIAGSVAVGKSTTARVLRKLLSLDPATPRVDLITTDGYLYPNRILQEKGLMDRKGFPESYDAISLLSFLSAVKSGREHLQSPLYSHFYYDVIPNEYEEVNRPDVLIVEGINVLQVTTAPEKPKRSVFVSDFFDFSIYVDADKENIRKWYIERFMKLQRTAFQDPGSYFHRYAQYSEEACIAAATQIWEEINLPNLEHNIEPTRLRSDLILEKGDYHLVRSVRLRKI